MDNIIINLSESRNAQKFSSCNLIHAIEFDYVISWINQRLAYINNIQPNNISLEQTNFTRLHETITILGTRGSGKTSFLLSILENYRNSKDIEVIKIIDPTLIEEKGHIFLTILSEINNRVTNALKSIDCTPEKADYFRKTQWNEQLKKMAKGLPAMDIINSGYNDWCDPEYVMNTGLQNVYAARQLETNFHELLRCGLQILNKKAFLIALDDIDIDFRKGWPVLETIRKYMTTPHVITLLSGDMRLLSKAIRKQQWKNFGKALLKNEGEVLGKMGEYNDYVTEMENQYMLKVLQPNRRIHLTTLKEKADRIDRTNETINIYINDETEDNRIDRFYNLIFKQLGITNPYQAEAYRSVMFGLPLREQIHFLSAFDKNREPADPNSLIGEIADVFLSDLYEKMIDIDQIKIHDQNLIPIILRLLIDEKVLEEAYQLQPVTKDQSLNISLMVLSFIFSLKTQDNPYLIFDYFLRIGYIRNILTTIGYQTNDKNILSPSIEHMCRFINAYNDKGTKDMACNISAYLHAAIRNSKDGEDFLGIINLPGLEQNQKQRRSEIAWRIDDVFKDTPKILRDIAFLPLSISQDNKINQGRLSYSIYTLLAVICEMIRKIKSGDTDDGLSTLAQLKSYPMPAFDRGNSFGQIDIELRDYESVDTNDRFLFFLRIWVNIFPKNYSVSPHLLGRISTRFFEALRTIESQQEQANLAESMHTRVMLFMNSILIEEAKENTPNIVRRLNINNPNLSDFIFVTNLQRINRYMEHYSDMSRYDFRLTRWICSCPLLITFLNLDYEDNNDTTLLSRLKEFTGNSRFISHMRPYSVYDKLSMVTYVDPNPKPETIQSNSDKPRFNSKKPSERAKVIDLLKQYDIPRYLFDKKENQTETVEANNKIRMLTKGLFVEENLKSYYIRQFRSYIAEHGIVW